MQEMNHKHPPTMAHDQAFPGPNISGQTTNDRASHIRHWGRARQQIDVIEYRRGNAKNYYPEKPAT